MHICAAAAHAFFLAACSAQTASDFGDVFEAVFDSYPGEQPCLQRKMLRWQWWARRPENPFLKALPPIGSCCLCSNIYAHACMKHLACESPCSLKHSLPASCAGGYGSESRFIRLNMLVDKGGYFIRGGILYGQIRYIWSCGQAPCWLG